MATLFTLPAHLRDAIVDLVAAEAAPEPLQKQLKATLSKAESDSAAHEAWIAEHAAAKAARRAVREAAAQKAQADAEQGQDDEKRHSTGEEQPYDPVDLPALPEEVAPATIDDDLLEAVSRWANSEDGRAALTGAGLDPGSYGHVALVAGTEVYLPPKQRVLMRAAERETEQADPYLPAHMSAQLPTLGSEYRATIKDISTALNVLFSIFGAGGAAYAAAIGGAGWKREQAVLLAVVVGIAVAIADVGLIMIFKDRLTTNRKRAGKLRVKMNRGSAREEDEGEGLDSVEKEVVVPVETITEKEEKRTLRLRRKPVGE